MKYPVWVIEGVTREVGTWLQSCPCHPCGACSSFCLWLRLRWQRLHPAPCARAPRGAAVPSWSPACSQGRLPGAPVFGRKQSGSGSQLLVCLCLGLLRQLGASQELPNGPVARA